MPLENAAVSAQVLCTPYNHAPCHFMQSHICKVYACLAVTCHSDFWQNDRDLLRATAVTRGWNGYRNDSQHRKLTLEKKNSKFFRHSCRDSNLRPFSQESSALITELSRYLPKTFHPKQSSPDSQWEHHIHTPLVHSGHSDPLPPWVGRCIHPWWDGTPQMGSCKLKSVKLRFSHYNNNYNNSS